MNLLTRLSLLVLLACGGLAAVFWLVQRTADRELDVLLADLRHERAQRLASAINLQGRGLEALVSSYAWWDDMVKFMDKPDPKWASENVDNIVGIPTGGDAAWIVDPEFRLLHTIDKDYGRPALPFADSKMLGAAIDRRYTFRYYTRLNGKLWEVFGAAIQDANFWRHETPVRGYLLIGKEWDDAWLSQLGTISGARVTLEPADSPASPLAHTQALNGLDGASLARMEARFNFAIIEQARQAHERDMLVLGGGALAALALMLGFIGFFVLRPLGQITRSLESRLPTPITGLLGSRTEFGEIARLLAGQLRWGQMLQEEMRRQLERANPETRQRDAESNEALRLRLAGNLHDGPIQTIYAASYHLGAIEAETRAGRPPTLDRLAETKAMLQQASSDLRNIILDLEPEELRDRDLDAALRHIERHLREFARCDFQLTIADGALDGLTRDAQTQLYFICRELASNALRHARPAKAALTFAIAAGFLRIEWANNGVTRTETPPASGNGLRNIERRALDLGGTASYGPHRGDGWRVVVEIPFTSLTAPVPAAV